MSTEKKVPIPARVYNASQGGHVAGAVDIIDDNKNKTQATINAENDAKFNQMDDEIEALEKQDVVPVNLLPAISSANPKKIYRVVGSTTYTDYMVNSTGDGWKELATFEFPGIDDEPTAGSDNLVKSGGVYTKIKTEVGEKINGIIYMDIDNFLDNKYIETSSNVGDKASLVPVDKTGFKFCRVDLNAGDNLYVKGVGSSRQPMILLCHNFSDDGGYVIYKVMNGTEVKEYNIHINQKCVALISLLKNYEGKVIVSRKEKASIEELRDADESLGAYVPNIVKDYTLGYYYGNHNNIGQKTDYSLSQRAESATVKFNVPSGTIISFKGAGFSESSLIPLYIVTEKINENEGIIKDKYISNVVEDGKFRVEQDSVVMFNFNAVASPYSVTFVLQVEKEISAMNSRICAFTPTYAPAEYGAVGNGVTDDSEAFLSMINDVTNNSVINLDGKSYLVSNIVIDKSLTIQNGILKAIKENDVSKNIITSDVDNISIKFENVEFDGNCTTQQKTKNATQSLIHVWNADNVEFVGCKVHNHSCGTQGEEDIEWAKRAGCTVSIFNTKNVVFERCDFYSNYTETIFVGGYNEEDTYKEFVNLIVKDCTSHDNTNSQALFTLFNLKSANIYNNDFRYNNTGFFNVLSSNVNIHDNYLDTCGKRGIAIEAGHYLKVTNCYICNNVIKNCASNAIETGTKDITIIGNRVYDCGGGINISGFVYKELQHTQETAEKGIPYARRANVIEKEGNIVVSDNSFYRTHNWWEYPTNCIEDTPNVKPSLMGGMFFNVMPSHTIDASNNYTMSNVDNVTIRNNFFEVIGDIATNRGFIYFYNADTFKSVIIDGNTMSSVKNAEMICFVSSVYDGLKIINNTIICNEAISNILYLWNLRQSKNLIFKNNLIDKYSVLIHTVGVTTHVNEIVEDNLTLVRRILDKEYTLGYYSGNNNNIGEKCPYSMREREESSTVQFNAPKDTTIYYEGAGFASAGIPLFIITERINDDGGIIIDKLVSGANEKGEYIVKQDSVVIFNFNANAAPYSISYLLPR